MKVLIVSDTHKSHRNLEKVLGENKDIDMLIHLGDVEGAEDYIEALADCPVHMVSGNNDFFSDLPAEEVFMIGGHRVFITHGHYYGIVIGEERLAKAARDRNADVVMYGHTHRPFFKEEDGLTILNPGSIAYPRQLERRASYMLMEVDEEDRMHFELKYV